MSPDSRRADRVAKAIREEIARFLTEGAKDPRIVGFVTVTGVDVTRDLRYARVFVSVLGSDAERARTLEGLASHDVVAIARRALGTRRVGHGGTLDPFATGLLVLLVGRATRLAPYLDDEPKHY